MLMGARYYSASLGRFISRDEIGFEGGPNPYVYCAGDPIDFMHPSGQNAVGDWYWGGMGGLSQAVDNSFLFHGATAAFGDAAGRYDSGKADGMAVAAAAGNWGLRVGMAGLVGGRGLALAAATPRLAAAAMPALAAAHPERLSGGVGVGGSVMRLTGPDEEEAISGAGGFVESAARPGRGMTRIFEPNDLPRALVTLPGRTHLVEMPVEGGWTAHVDQGGARIGADAFGHVVDVERLNSFKAGDLITNKAPYQ